MPLPALSAAIGRARRAVLPDDTTDGELVTRFVGSRDEAAFAALVARLGPMVRAVCRRGVSDPHLADDAFQATFLVLARRAADVRPREAVRAFVYGVAVRTTREARAMFLRRRSREKLVPTVPDRPIEEEPLPDEDTLRALDEEVARLPDHLRAAVVLCELEGLSRREAAGRLGVHEGTLSSRLAKARKVLATQLRGRGVAVPAVGAIGLFDRVSAGPVPTALSDAATALAGPGLIPAHVAELSRKVFQTMLWNKLKCLTVGLVVVAATIGGAATIALRDARATDPKADSPKPAAPPAGRQYPAMWTTGPGKLLVERDNTLWLANPDGSQPITITPPAGTDLVLPRLSPDHRRVAFILQDKESRSRPVGDRRARVPDRVMIQDRVEKEPGLDLKLDGMGLGVSWAPDGTAVLVSEVIVGNDPEKPELRTWLIDIATRAKTRLDLPRSVWVQDWATDGKTLLAFIMKDDKPQLDLAIISLDGKTTSKLTTLHSFSQSARLSPDRTTVLYTDGDPDEKPGPDENPARLHLYLLDVKTKVRTRVAAVPKAAFVHGGAWSTHGERFVFTWTEVHPRLNKKVMNGGDMEVDTRSYLVVCDKDGSNPKTVVTEKSLYATGRPLGTLDWR